MQRGYDIELRRAIQEMLQRRLSTGRTKSQLAKTLQIPRAQLDRYLSSSVKPRSASVKKMLEKLNDKVMIRGLLYGAEHFGESEAAAIPLEAAVQQALPFDRPLVLDSGDQSLTIEVQRKPAGELEVKLRLVNISLKLA